MRGCEVILPGGIVDEHGLERHARFQLLTGRLEKAIAEADDHDRASYVSSVLALALDTIGQEAAGLEQVRQLCVADREFLMLQLASLLDGEQLWLKLRCAYCDALFDVDVRRDQLPVKQAGKGYPFAEIELNGHRLRLRVPIGKDQEGLFQLEDEVAMQQLLQRCITEIDGNAPERNFVQALGGDDINHIDAALDEASPAVCNRLHVRCPECDGEQQAEIDHYTLNGLDECELYGEVHTLASHYHWSEESILDLPQDRRRRYLALINRSLGVLT